MYDINANAYRRGDSIYVTITGYLPNSCYTAQIVDKYPGGNIIYIRDPGTAQVFIEESYKPGSGVCIMVLVPWVAHINIIDDAHDQVTVFVNGEPTAKVAIKEEPKEFRVIALTAAGREGYRGCSVIPADAFYLSIYSSVYGPASKTECDEWVSDNCPRALDGEWPFPLSTSGGVPGPFLW